MMNNLSHRFAGVVPFLTESEFEGFFLQNLQSRDLPPPHSRDSRHQFDNNNE
jgi:hypothetical protein